MNRIKRFGSLHNYFSHEYNLDWDGALSTFFSMLDKKRITVNDIMADTDAVDFEVLRVLNELIAECGTDRQAISSTLPNLM